METIERVKMYKVKDDILLYINKDIFIKFNKVFEWPESNGSRIGHINIWENNAPFYFLFNSSIQKKLTIKGFSHCYFLPNSYYLGFDKNNKTFLRCTYDDPNCYLNYYPISSINDLRKLVKMRQEGHWIEAGFPRYRDGIAITGEAFEIVKVK